MEQIFGIILSAGFGAIFGSYATLFAYRLPRLESCFGRYFGQKSRCPKCASTIRTRELIPLLNWLFTLGKCKTCQVKIPRTHLFIELSCTILFVICYLQFSFSEEFIIHSLICVLCVILIVTDFTHNAFPYQLLNTLLIAGLVNRILIDQTIIDAVYSSVVGAVFATIFYQIFYKKSSGLFATQQHSLDYTKFILIAAVCLNIADFLIYFLAVIAVFTMMLLFDIPNKRKRFGFGYCIITPFLWLILI